ncbi:hypothetical protein V2J09_007984 [Rumex salicifolius]
MLVYSFATLVIPFLFFLYKWSFVNGKNLPPSPPSLPIIGNLHQIGKTPYRSLKALSQKHGELMLLHLGSKPTLVVSSKEMASQVLKTHESCFSERIKLATAKSSFFKAKDLFFSPYGEHWRSLRSLCMLRLFSTKRVNSFRGVREDEVAVMIRKIMGSPKPVVNLSEFIFTLTNNLICRAAFGRTYGEDEEGERDEFERLIKGVISVSEGSNVADVLPWMGWINRFNGVNANINRISKGFEVVADRIIQEQAQCIKETRDDDETSSVEHFVDILLQAQRDNLSNNNTPLDNETIKGVIFVTECESIDTTESFGSISHKKYPLLVVPTPKM